MPLTPQVPKSSKWRFSLKTLFLLTLLAAFAVWLTSWQMWDTDERIILGSWSLVMGTIYFSRHHGWPGILLTTVACGMIPAGLAFSYYAASELIWEYCEIDRSDIPFCAMFVAVSAAMSGGVIAVALTPVRLADLPPSQREDRLQSRLIFVGCFAGAVVLFIGAWSVYQRSTRWKLLGVNLGTAVAHGEKNISISSDGSHLKVVVLGEPGQRSVIVWKLAPLENAPALVKRISTKSITATSRNADWVAIADVSPPSATISVVQCPAGKEAATLTIPSILGSFDDATIRFSADDTELRFSVRKFDGRASPKTYRWQVRNWKSLPSIEEDDSAFGGSKFYVKVIECEDSQLTEPMFRVELWDLAVKNLLYQFEPFSNPYPIVLSPDEAEIAIHDSLINLKTKERRRLSAVIEQYLPQSEVLLCSRRYDPGDDRHFGNGAERSPLPFVRHFWSDWEWKQLVLVDRRTGATICRSQWVPGDHYHLEISKDGKVALTVDSDRVVIWKLPEFAQ